MSTALWLVCAATLGQPLAETHDLFDGGVAVSHFTVDAQLPPPDQVGKKNSTPDQPETKPSSPIPGFDPNQPLNFLYTQPPPEQAGKKNPSAGMPPTEEKKAEGTEASASERPSWYSVHAQGTFVYDASFPFHDPYDGPNSALGRVMNHQTATGTLYFDFRPWQGGEIIFNPEFSGGTGLDGTVGFAGFPNGEATRVGALEPTAYVARLLYRHTFEFEGESEKVEDAANRIAGIRSRNRFSISVGKMSAEDVLDDNVYSHDPRTQFLNWSLMYTGAWDYPANTRGYTYGALFDFTTMFYSVRYGIFGEPSAANGPEIDPHILKAHGQIVEFQENFILDDQPAHLREWAFANASHAGNYREALAEPVYPPDITLTRSYRTKYGFGASFDKEITPDLGFLMRAGWNDGQSETWAFTEIDATAAVGLQLKGTHWHRPSDIVGLAGVMNGLSNAHRDYLEQGGVGFIIGDGRLHYAPEEILETYYNCELKKGINFTLDLQGIDHPAYNQDRGPALIAGARVHLEY
jgi:high affinity Mn2+ porin